MASFQSKILFCCCNRKGLFAVQGTSDRILDVPATFSPQGVVALAIKLVVLGLSITAVVFSAISSGASLFFLAYLTNWGLIWTLLYSILSLYNTIVTIKQPTSDFVGLRAASTWLMFDMAAHTQIMASILYWALVHRPQWGHSFSRMIRNGGLMIALLIEGQTMNRIPIRWNHFPLVFMVHMAFLIWALVHGIYEIGSPAGQPNAEEEDEQIIYYDVVDSTGGNPKATGTLAVIIQLGIVPVLYGILWLISLPCRRYKRSTKGTKRIKTKDVAQEQASVYSRITDDSTTLSSDTFVSKNENNRSQQTTEV